MTSTISNFFIVFLLAIELLIFTYFVLNPLARIVPNVQVFMKELKIITDPVLNPCRFLLRKSIFHSSRFDFSPIVAFLILEYTVIIIQNYAK